MPLGIDPAGKRRRSSRTPFHLSHHRVDFRDGRARDRLEIAHKGDWLARGEAELAASASA